MPPPPCLSQTAVFFSASRPAKVQAAALCGRCPYIDKCLTRALALRPVPASGTWAGIDFGSRSAVLAARAALAVAAA